MTEELLLERKHQQMNIGHHSLAHSAAYLAEPPLWTRVRTRGAGRGQVLQIKSPITSHGQTAGTTRRKITPQAVGIICIGRNISVIPVTVTVINRGCSPRRIVNAYVVTSPLLLQAI